jgi:hypothetical protein
MAEIQDTDYNSLHNLIKEVMGTGTSSFGYGQSVVSSPVFQGNIITAAQWDSLKFDIINAILHQEGFSPTIADVSSGDVIRETSADPKVNYAAIIESARENRFKLSPNQSVLSAIDTKTFTGSWSTSAELILTMTFGSSNDARHFFNSGSEVGFTATRTGGTVSQQNNSWTSLLSAAGRLTFSEIAGSSGFYELTNSYTVISEVSNSAPYADNSVRVEARCNVADNSAGTATIVEVKLNLLDSYQDQGPPAPGDLVDGTIEIEIDERKASGTLQPAGTGSFSVTSPSYAVGNISAS